MIRYYFVPGYVTNVINVTIPINNLDVKISMT